MPLYEYQCPKCGRFELIQKFSDTPLKTCPTCGSEVQKLLSAPAIQFKGTGWYITDYARKGAGKDGKGESAKSEGTTTEGAKTEGAKEGASSSGDTKAPATSSTGAKDSGGSAKS